MTRYKDRVGGRHRDPPLAPGGGRYSDNCNDRGSAFRPSVKNFEKKFKITINDLKAIGLTGKWLEIAEAIGSEKWLIIWEILDRENIDMPTTSRDSQRLRVPAYSKLKKFRRNRYIEQLINAGFNTRQIHRELELKKIDPVSVPMIRKIQKTIIDREKND